MGGGLKRGFWVEPGKWFLGGAWKVVVGWGAGVLGGGCRFV